MLNSDQKDYMADLDQRPRSELCPCGWYTETECVTKCFTGTRDDAPSLVRRIKQIYSQIDRANRQESGT